MASALAEYVFLPRPRTFTPGAGVFSPRPGMRIVLHGEANGLVPAALRLKQEAARMLGMEWAVACARPG